MLTLITIAQELSFRDVGPYVLPSLGLAAIFGTFRANMEELKKSVARTEGKIDTIVQTQSAHGQEVATQNVRLKHLEERPWPTGRHEVMPST